MGITIQNNFEVHISEMDSPFQVGIFLQILHHLIFEKNKRKIVFNFNGVERVFPNTVVPISGIIDFYQKQGIEFECHNTPLFLQKTCFQSPLIVSGNLKEVNRSPLNRIWRFENDSDTNVLSNEILGAISQEVICQEGVIDAMLWCMNEIMDNVIVHAEANYGFVMCQIHKQSKHIAFCVYDNGRGIFNSLKNSIHAPSNDTEAIRLAIQERVTRDKKIGQGNGMWGLSEIVRQNAGQLTIISGSGLYMRTNGDEKMNDHLTALSPENGACLVDFQLKYNKIISITQALNGHQPVNYRTERYEDDSGMIHFKLSEAATGTGTRESGRKIRNDLINMFHDTKKGILIDFEGLTVISSSFADELVGKMLVHFGFAGFNDIVRLKHMNPTIQAIVQRSVAQRMSEAFT
jgi:hypothetical protein